MSEPMKSLRKKLLNESGQVMVLAVLCLTVLLGFVAFAVDVGILLRQKRIEQTAADSAALAGAAEISYGDVTAGAQNDAAQNGVPSSAVSVHNPPISGPNSGNSAYVEVDISENQPTFFMNVFHLSSLAVGARAVATNVPEPSCVDTLSQTPPSGFGVDLSGGADLALTGCGLTDDATGSSAFKASGGITVTASFLGVVGSTDIHNGASIMGSTWPAVSTPPIVTGITPINDPLVSLLTAPPSSEYTSGCSADPNIRATTTIGPSSASGYVCYQGLTITRSPTVTLNPGLYIIDGEGASAFSFSVAGGATVNGTSGVSFYFVNNGSFTFSNGATMNLTAPTTSTTSVGINAGILFYQDSGDTAADTFEGGSAGNINGIFYLPAANLTFQNGNASTFSTDLVVGSLTMSGAGTLTPYAPLSGASPLSTPRLSE
jgi:Flp pilus assembly protein TadG